jgi:hypothetical protein
MHTDGGGKIFPLFLLSEQRNKTRSFDRNFKNGRTRDGDEMKKWIRVRSATATFGKTLDSLVDLNCFTAKRLCLKAQG